MRFIVECDEPTDMILGMRAIEKQIRADEDRGTCWFEDGSIWSTWKTKTGYSTRKNPTITPRE